MSCPCLYFSFSLFLTFSLSVYPLSSPLLAKGKEKRYTCKRCGRTCVYEARLYTYESRRISGHTTGAEISFIYPRLPASLLTVYLQHLIHHSRIVCGYSGARVCACMCAHRDSAEHPMATVCHLVCVDEFFWRKLRANRGDGMQTSLVPFLGSAYQTRLIKRAR